jgi:carboxypeptidase Q
MTKFWLAAFIVLLPSSLWALQGLTTDALVNIRHEASDNSQVMDDAFYLSDVYGPRFVGSPNIEHAADWTRARLKAYGLSNIRVEELKLPINVGGLSWSGRGWSYDNFAISATKPEYVALIGEPVMFSESTDGIVRGEVAVAQLPEPGNEVALNAFVEQFKGKLRQKMLLIAPIQQVKRPAADDFVRRTDAELGALSQAVPEQKTAGSNQAAQNQSQSGPDPGLEQYVGTQIELFAFLRKEGALALVAPAPGGGGTDFVVGPIGPPDPTTPPPPSIALAPEHYNRIFRLVQHEIPVELQLQLHTEFRPGAGVFNVLADIPGDGKKNEIVLLGAHLDSFHVGTGATDNAAGVALVMETVRILEALHLHMARTVRVALWGGEEMDRQGSRDYVRQHFVGKSASPERLTCYFNVDHGSGKIRGIYLQGHQSLVPLFRKWLESFNDVGASTISLKEINGSDQKSFNDVVLPGLAFIEDPLDYESRTNHTNMDTYDYLAPDDLKQSAAILATLVYRAATADENVAELAAARPQ